MLIVDTHCHALPHWFEPVEVLLHQMHANGVEKALLVQVRGQFDNRYLIECVRRFPGRFAALRVPFHSHLAHLPASDLGGERLCLLHQ